VRKSGWVVTTAIQGRRPPGPNRWQLKPPSLLSPNDERGGVRSGSSRLVHKSNSLAKCQWHSNAFFEQSGFATETQRHREKAEARNQKLRKPTAGCDELKNPESLKQAKNFDANQNVTQEATSVSCSCLVFPGFSVFLYY
jgi:hypothetical protein